MRDPMVVVARLAVRTVTGPTRDQVRAKASEVFRRSEFVEHENYVQRFLRWLQHFFHFNPSPNQIGAAGSTSSGLGKLFLYLVLVVVIAGLVWAVWRAISDRSPRVRKEKDQATVAVEEVRTTSQWGRDADRAEAEGQWKEAIRCRYRELVGALIDRGALPAVPGRTTGELRGDLAETVPAAVSDFDHATLLFELPWYADADTGPAENATMRQLAATVLATTPERVAHAGPPSAALEVEIVDGAPVGASQ